MPKFFIDKPIFAWVVAILISLGGVIAIFGLGVESSNTVLKRSPLFRGEFRDAWTRFDVKQGEGGLVDLEFLLQFLVLRDAARIPSLVKPRDTQGLLEAVGTAGLLEDEACAGLRRAHAVLLEAGLRCTLDRRPRLLPETGAIADARDAIRSAREAAGL